MLPDTFDTARLLLRPIAVEDAEAIFDIYAQDKEVTRYTIWKPHHSRAETQAYVESLRRHPGKRRAHLHARGP